MQFHLINICPKVHHWKWQNYTSHCMLTCQLFRTFSTSPAACWCCSSSRLLWKLCCKLPSIVTFTFMHFLIKNLSSLLNGIKVSMCAWYSIKIRVIFGVRFERRKVNKKSKRTCKLKHANSILVSVEYFCQMLLKLILMISSYTVSNLVHFDTQYVCLVYMVACACQCCHHNPKLKY